MRTALEKVALFFGDNTHRIGEVVIDAIVKESHRLRAQAMEHPTESGESFVDHVQNLPTTVEMEGIITNTPSSFLLFPAVKSFHNFVTGESNDLAEQAFGQLEEIFTKREPITIMTSLKEYDDMVLESLSVERNSHTSESLHFRASAKQIRMVNQALIEIPQPKVLRAKPKKNLGKQETETASLATKEAIKKQSSLVVFTNWMGELWK